MKTKKRALTAYEDTNMYGGAHEENYLIAKKALEQNRDIIVHSKHYNGQRYYYNKYRVHSLEILKDDTIVGITEQGEHWEATKGLCDYATFGRI